MERIYSLGDFQNVKFTDTITDIPDDSLLNEDVMKSLRYLQIVEIEWSYINYMYLKSNRPSVSDAESLEVAKEFIEKERTTAFKDLLSSITPQPNEIK